MKRTIAAAIFALLAVPTPARAVLVDLPPASATAIASGGTSTIINNSGPPPQVATYISSDPFGGHAVAAAGVPLPAAVPIFGSAGSGVSATAFGGAFAQATESYFFTILGPPGTLPIPLSLASTLSAIVQNANSFGNNSEAGSNISYDGHKIAQRSSAPNSTIVLPPSIFALAGSVNEVDLFAEAASDDPQEKEGTFAQASAGLTIQIDPRYLATHPGYSLKFSQGITNEPLNPVPLPAALPMFGSAIAGLGGAGWWKRRKESRNRKA
jgi:hypothetical protein